MLQATSSRRSFALAGLLFLLTGSLAGAQTKRPLRPEREGTLTYKDVRLGGKIPPRSWQIFVARENQANKDYGPNVDPKFNATYPGKLQVTCSSEEEEPRSERTFVVHFQRPEDEMFARRVAAVLARIYWLGQDYLGVGPAPGRYVNVWLARHGEPGAEEFQKNIYLFAIDQDRTPAEWVRELAHEYAHAFLPPVGEYVKPEKWANGYLGERLFLKWLLYDNGMGDVWTEPIDGAAYVKSEVEPLRDRALNAGPTSPLLDQTDEAGMEHWIGQVLALEATHGPTVLRELLRNYQTPRPQGLPTYLGQVLQDLQPAQFPIEPAVFVPEKSEGKREGAGAASGRKLCYSFYLPGGRWQFTVSGQLPEGTSLSLATLDVNKVSTGGAVSIWETTMPGAVGSWQRLEITVPEGQTATVQSITVLRKG